MTSDYHQLLTRMIDAAKADAAIRRSYVYELARIQLLRSASSQTPPWSNTQILQELQVLDEAIAKVEAYAAERPAPERPSLPETPTETERPPVASPPPSSRVARLRASLAGPVVRLGLVTSVGIGVYVVLATGSVEIPFLKRALLTPKAPLSEALRTPSPAPGPASAPAPASTPAAAPAPAPAAATPLSASPAQPAPADPPASSRPQTIAPAGSEPDERARLVPMSPDRYGIWAIRAGQLTELNDVLPRQSSRGVERAIVEPSRIRFADGKLSFLIRQREFISTPPNRIVVNVVARIAREVTSDKGKKTSTPLSGFWVLLPTVGSEFRVVPLPERKDTVLAQPDPPEAALPPGRYVLMLGGDAYDFTIEGNVSDPAHCVERNVTATTDSYEQCPVQ